MDWWDARLLRIPLPSAAGGAAPTGSVRVSCTPAQHTAARGAFDRWRTLWASWAVEEVMDGAESALSTIGKKVWFAGDTGYKTVRDGEDEASLPVCPAFAEIGRLFGGFDLALIPIG